tara:strand:- start:658 stop:918 length:261 start_codon:yes stop_codon:yes gene_type:complete
VYEALTATDRSYKKPKTLSKNIQIISLMVKDQHLDGELFILFLESDVNNEYALAYLLPLQLDKVEVAKYPWIMGVSLLLPVAGPAP